jgi:hypothetical protein
MQCRPQSSLANIQSRRNKPWPAPDTRETDARPEPAAPAGGTGSAPVRNVALSFRGKLANALRLWRWWPSGAARHAPAGATEAEIDSQEAIRRCVDAFYGVRPGNNTGQR